MRSSQAGLISLLIITGIIGCSTAGGNPSLPSLNSALDSAQMASTHALSGMWRFDLKPDEEQVDIMPIRGADMHINVLPFLEPPANVNLTIEGPPQFAGGVVTVDIGLKHPFPTQTLFTGFDVKGIVIGQGSDAIQDIPQMHFATENELRLLNADGYTRWWNPREFPPDAEAPMFGYKDGLLGRPDSVQEIGRAS